MIISPARAAVDLDYLSGYRIVRHYFFQLGMRRIYSSGLTRLQLYILALNLNSCHSGIQTGFHIFNTRKCNKLGRTNIYMSVTSYLREALENYLERQE